MGRHRTIDESELLGIARQVFQERGHTATSRVVARVVGISQAVLYQPFRTKDVDSLSSPESIKSLVKI